jgi:hypothetical protein
VIQLQGTSGGPSFLDVLDANQAPITSADGTVGYGTSTLTIENLTGRLGPSHTITLSGNPLVRISNTVDFAVVTQPSPAPIATSGSATFVLDGLNSNGATTRITISGEDSVAGPFFFTCTVTSWVD